MPDIDFGIAARHGLSVPRATVSGMLRAVSSHRLGRDRRLPIAKPDPRFDLGLYSIPEAARLARVPSRTLWNWVHGYRYPSGGRRVRAKPVLEPTPADQTGSLSFTNLTEVLALSGFRQLGVSMQKVRRALEYVKQEMKVEHPLATQRILSDGVELFWEYQERARDEIHLVNIVRGGQKVFSETVMRYLHEIEWGRDDFATRWWPGSGQAKDGPVVVDPRRAFGSPVLVGTGIRTEDVFLRFSAGEPITEIASDYGLTFEQTEAALRAEARFLEAQAA
jgi:uncharacterized protein (DUF433 family)